MEIKAVRIIPILLFFRTAFFSESCDCVRTGYSFGGFGDFLHSSKSRTGRNGGGFRLRIGSPRQWVSAGFPDFGVGARAAGGVVPAAIRRICPGCAPNPETLPP